MTESANKVVGSTQDGAHQALKKAIEEIDEQIALAAHRRKP